jgi:putative ABC transport system permease protein
VDGLNLTRSVSQVEWVDMAVAGSGKLRYGRSTLNQVFIGTTADALRSLASDGQVQPAHWPDGKAFGPSDFLAEGRFFTPAEALSAAEICVLGEQTALDLFAGDDPLNATVWVNRKPCTVIGVLAELETIDPAQRYTSQVNNSFYLPISTVILEQFSQEPAVQIDAHVHAASQINQAKAQVVAYLRQQHGVVKNSDGTYSDDFNITTRSDVLGAQLDAARTFSILLAAMAIISLFIGGIGIMNVMLVSVTERTREIGVRRAVGARAGDIVRQFLLEALLISAAGGMLGIALGILTVPLAASLNQGMALLEPGSIPLAFGVALVIGIGFGIYPAIRAAHMDPIQALKYE